MTDEPPGRGSHTESRPDAGGETAAGDTTSGDDSGRLLTIERIGGLGLVLMLFTHLIWDPALTLLGVSQFGIEAEGTPFVRTLLRIHPLAWIAAKLVVVGGTGLFMYRVGVHRDPATAWGPWLLAIVGFVAPLGWLERLL